MSQQNSGNPSPKPASSIVDDARDQIATFASDSIETAKRKVGDAVSNAPDVSGAAGGLVDQVKGAASQASDRVMSALDEQKAAGADKVNGFAESLRRAASEIEKELPPAGGVIRQAADQIDAVSDALRRRDIGELVGNVQDFARRQPAAFLGVSVLLGFAAVRLLKAPLPAAKTPPLPHNEYTRGIGRYGEDAPNTHGRSVRS